MSREGNAFGSGEASALPPVVRAALVRDYVARDTARRAAARTVAVVPVEADDAPAMMKCANCGTSQPDRDTCGVCGEVAS